MGALGKNRAMGQQVSTAFEAHRWRLAGSLLMRRALVALPATIGLTALVFALASIAPFNPLASYLGSSYAHTSIELREKFRTELGLDQSWLQVWTHWISRAMHGDLGSSLIAARPVTQVLSERIPLTFLLTASGLILAIGTSLLLSLAAVKYRHGLVDRIVLAIAQLAQSIPLFVVALLAIAVIALPLGWPTGGIAAAGEAPSFGSLFTHLLLPAAVLAFSLLPWLLLNLRTSLIEAMDSDSILAAQGRGAKNILLHEALPQALLPFITVIGSRLGELITGALIIETIFAWPGIASAVIESAVAGDFALLAAVTTCSALAVFAGNALADAAYLMADARVSNA